MKEIITTGDTVKFIDGRSAERTFKVSGTNDKVKNPRTKELEECVDIQFQAFGYIATIRNCRKDLLEKVK